MTSNMKNNLKPTLTLGVICIVVALLLAAVNLVASPIIDERSSEAVKESLGIVMPDGSFNAEPDELRATAPDTVKAVYTEKTGKGTVVTLVTNKGYEGKEIAVTVAIDTSGKIIKAVVTKNEDSIVPPSLKPMGNYGDAFSGASADNVTDVNTGVTVSYTDSAIKNALLDALNYVNGKDAVVTDPTPEEPVRPYGEVYSLALGMIDGATALEELDLTSDTLKKAYKHEASGAYVFYTVTSTRWVPVETECLVAVDKNGVVTNIKLLTWTVGYDDSIYDAPPQYTTEQLNSYIGKNEAALPGVDLVTGVTRTSMNLMNAVRNAVKSVVYAPIDAIASEMLGGAVLERVCVENAPETLKATYYDKISKSHVFYLITSTQYVDKETEGLVAVDGSGKIIGIKLLTWTVGHGVNYDEAYLNSFVGKRYGDLKHVDLVTTATGTSNNFKFAVRDAIGAVYGTNTAYTYIAIVLMIAFAAAFVAGIIYSRRRARK